MRLAEATLDRLPAEVARFSYDRAAQRIGIVHFGIGAFHRAHQAWYTDVSDPGITLWTNRDGSTCVRRARVDGDVGRDRFLGSHLTIRTRRRQTREVGSNLIAVERRQ